MHYLGISVKSNFIHIELGISERISSVNDKEMTILGYQSNQILSLENWVFQNESVSSMNDEEVRNNFNAISWDISQIKFYPYLTGYFRTNQFSER